MRFVAHLNDGSYINVPADRMEEKENVLRAWNGTRMMAVVEVTAVISAHMAERTANDSG